MHLSGVWNTKEFFKFLVKFGFQQTNVHELEETQGYIYGNVTSLDNVRSPIALVVLDSEYFLYYFGNRSVRSKSDACRLMFGKIDGIAWDENCHATGAQDLLRHIPCQHNRLCDDETDPELVLPGTQFTYRVRDTNQPRFWFVSFVSCHRNTSSCLWSQSPAEFTLNYDIWIVNGRPDLKHLNPLEHQFSYDQQDTVELYSLFSIVYSLLLPVQLYALFIQRHPLPLLLSVCMALEYLGVLFNLLHVAKFSIDGTGFPSCRVTGNFIDTASQCLFMLLLLLVVKGWTITCQSLPWTTRLILFSVWAAYTTASIALFVWNQTEVDLISDVGEYQTWPGWLILTFRLLIMLWFLFELRETFRREQNTQKTKFYLHFGAGFLVWFIYLPLLTLVTSQVSALWRNKAIISVSYSADLLSLCVLVHLLWPSRSRLQQVFNLQQTTHTDNFSALNLLKREPSESDDNLWDNDIDDDESTLDIKSRFSTQPHTDTLTVH